MEWKKTDKDIEISVQSFSENRAAVKFSVCFWKADSNVMDTHRTVVLLDEHGINNVVGQLVQLLDHDDPMNLCMLSEKDGIEGSDVQISVEEELYKLEMESACNCCQYNCEFTGDISEEAVIWLKKTLEGIVSKSGSDGDGPKIQTRKIEIGDPSETDDTDEE